MIDLFSRNSDIHGIVSWHVECVVFLTKAHK